MENEKTAPKSETKENAAAEMERRRQADREVGAYNGQRHARFSRRWGTNWRGKK